MLTKCVAVFLLFALSCFGADIELYIDDLSGNLGKVDIATGAVTLLGSDRVVLSDIAFAPNGTLYGISFSDLYTVNPSNGAATLVGPLTGVSGSTNALVFGSNGDLYAASGDLYTINTGTGAATTIGAIGYDSGGDLAFLDGTLYLSTSSNQLVTVNTTTGAGSLVGDIGVQNVFGLASPGNGVLYGVAGTTVYFIDPSTGAGTLDLNYGGHGLVPMS